MTPQPTQPLQPRQLAPRRIGVFGGAFDPPHHTHVALVAAGLCQLNLDEMRVFPTGNAWHKTRSLSPAAHRLAMAQLAFAHLHGVVVDDREMHRTGPSYTVDTLRELKSSVKLGETAPDLFLLMGGDQARALPTWQQWQEVASLAIICVADRAYSTGAKPVFYPQNGVKSGFLHLQMPSSPLSATDIRLRLARHENVTPLVGEAVARYIADHHLYQ